MAWHPLITTVSHTAPIGGSAAYRPVLYKPIPAVDEDERFTLDNTFEWGKQIANVEMFDVDVAACAQAHRAPIWYNKETDGLKQHWMGRVWANVPFSNIWPWIEKAWYEFSVGHAQVIVLLMPGNRQEQKGWQQLVEPFRDGRDPKSKLTTHYPPGRQVYGSPSDPRGLEAGSPPFGTCALKWQL